MATVTLPVQKSRHGVGWWSKRIATGLMLSVVAALTITTITGAVIKTQLKAKYPPVGQMVDVGGYKLHIHCEGEGGPTVVMDTGAGASGLAWALVQPEVAKASRVCVYDRAGFGWSDLGPKPRTNELMVEELRTLLQNAGIPGPYVLVGHSLGGLNMKIYAHKYPAEVAGLVLVDATHEEQFLPEPMPETMKKVAQAMPIFSGVARTLIATGILPLNPSILAGLSGSHDPRMPQEVSDTIQALQVMSSKHFTANAAETAAILESHAQVRAMQIKTFGDLPLIVIRHGIATPQMTPEVTELVHEINDRLQAETAAMSTRGKLLTAEKAGHGINVDQPQIIVEAIKEMLAMVRM
jgi:pimeloyl-ACP methyl ester carboxylesterase